MLRRRLLIIVGPLVCLLMITAIIGIWLLEGTLANMDYVNDTVMGTTDQVADFVNGIRDTRRGIHELELGHKSQAAPMGATMAQTAHLMETINESAIVHQPAIAPALLAVQGQLPDFQRMIAALAAAPNSTQSQIDAAMSAANAIDANASQLGRLVRDEAHMEHQRLSDRLRRQVLILAIVFLVMINLAIIALLRAASMILRPVDQLVKVAHELGQEHFEARVQIDDDNEFGQLAEAYNHMAQQLQASEQRKMEFLGQVALTMSHELNNVINIIELQLTVLSRRAGDSEPLQAPLKQIRQSLGRMTGVIDALRHTRRIVLTDYMEGVKMLDLRQSTQETNLAEEMAPAGPRRKCDP
ncbi:MAG: HAMP domain-containing protein [Tepidisphaeraceae bacterium]|jgi:methyl-accepting chemotaxis protein